MAETYFFMVVNEDGTITSHIDIPETLPERNRIANNWDVYSTARQITEEFDRQVLVDRVIQGVVGALAPKEEPTTSQKIKDALKDRGIDPESITPSE